MYQEQESSVEIVEWISQPGRIIVSVEVNYELIICVLDRSPKGIWKCVQVGDNKQIGPHRGYCNPEDAVRNLPEVIAEVLR